MNRTRVKLAVYVELDPIPGTFHTAESAHQVIRNILVDRIPHYKPMVSIESYDTKQEHNFTPGDPEKRTPSGGIPWGEDLERDCKEMQKLEGWGIFPVDYHYNNCSLH